MFDSIFRRRKEQLEAQPFLRRIIDRVTPDMPRADESRYFRRYGRTIPVCVWQLKGGKPIGDSSLIAITKNVTDDSAGIVTTVELEGDEYCMAIWPPAAEWEDPVFFHCELRRCDLIAHGLWEVGFYIDKMFDCRGYSTELRKIAESVLRPKQAASKESHVLQPQ